MPSPTIATVLPVRLKRAHLLDLLLRQHLGDDAVDAGLRRDRFGRAAVVARQHARPRCPSACSSATASRAPGFTVSATAITPATWPSIGDEHRRLALLRERLDLRREPVRARSARSSHQAEVAEHDAAPFDHRLDAVARHRVEVARVGERQAALVRLAHDRFAERMLGAALGARGQAQQLVGTAGRSATITSVTEGLPSVIVPVLSKTTVSTLCAVSSASPPRIRMPISAPLPVPTMIAVGVARPSAHGQAMISTATALSSAYVNAGSGPNASQTRNVPAAISDAPPARSTTRSRRPGAAPAPSSPAPPAPAE